LLRQYVSHATSLKMNHANLVALSVQAAFLYCFLRYICRIARHGAMRYIRQLRAMCHLGIMKWQKTAASARSYA
jgi:hypothetical protein